MTGDATSRYGLRAAPGGLALVQDFLNTASAGVPLLPDLLDDPRSAGRWAWSMTRGAEPPVDPAEASVFDAHDVQVLRVARDVLRSALQDAPATPTPPAGPAALEAEVVLRWDGLGRVTADGTRSGAQSILSRILIEILIAQVDGTWARLKTCRNPRCRSAFYDRSRNNSGVWHDVRTCGNAHNLRASRARARERSAAD